MKNKYFYPVLMIILYTFLVFLFMPVSYYQCGLFEGGCDRHEYMLGVYALNPYSALFTKGFEKGISIALSISFITSLILFYFLHKSKHQKKFKYIFWVTFSLTSIFLIVGYNVYTEILRVDSLKLEELAYKDKNPKHCEEIKIPFKIFGEPASSLHDALIYAKDMCFIYIIQQTNNGSLCSKLINPSDSWKGIDPKYKQVCEN